VSACIGAAAARHWRMVLVLRSFAAVFLTVLLALMPTAPARAAARVDNAALDRLFAQLRAAPDANTAYGIDQQIWVLWTTPNDADLAERMQQVLAARRAMDFRGALALLDRITADYPTYAEGWNQRATLHYLTNDLDQSLADIDKALQYEPRHFGALSGRALIHLARNERALALADMRAALAIHPFLAERQLFPELSNEEVTRI
jgi:tetratricopeptide (TPR) repeat protein